MPRICAARRIAKRSKGIAQVLIDKGLLDEDVDDLAHLDNLISDLALHGRNVLQNRRLDSLSLLSLLERNVI